MLRRHAGSAAVIGMVVAILFGGALTAAAGARRSATALARFVAYNRPENAFVVSADPSFDMTVIDRMPQVLATMTGGYVPLAPVGADGSPRAKLVGTFNGFLKISVVGEARDYSRPKLVAGRLDDPSKPLETVIDPELAAREHLSVGSRLRLMGYRPEELNEQISDRGVGAPHGPVLEFTVVGIALQPFDINPAEKDSSVVYQGTADMSLNAAFWATYRDQVAAIQQPELFRAVWLREGDAGFPAFTAALRALPGGDSALAAGSLSDAATSEGDAKGAISLESASLWALAGLLAAGGLLLGGQVATRQLRASRSDLGLLRTFGMRPRELLVIGAAPTVAGTLIGAVIGAAVAVAASPLTPVGLARQAEISPGLRLDPLVLLVGVISVVALMGTVALLSSARNVRSLVVAEQPASSRSLADRLASAGGPPSAVVGVRFALEPARSGAGAPVRTASAVATVGLLALAAVMSFTHSLDQLLASPRALGWNWDVTVGNPNVTQLSAENDALLERDPLVAGWARVESPGLLVEVNGIGTSVTGVDTVRGNAGPYMLAGRAPSAPGEVALGHRILAAARVAVGDEITLTFQGVQKRMRVVGSALTGPVLNNLRSLGGGVLMTTAAVRQLLPNNPISGGVYLLELRPGVRIEDAVPALQETWGRTVLRSLPPVDVVNVARVRMVPLVLAGLVGLAATVTLAFVLIATVRLRRRDLAVLKALGSSGRQLRSMVLWQATTLIAPAVLIGVPLGVVAGSAGWRIVARDLGILEGPRLPFAMLGAVVLGAFAVAVAVATPPARVAARTPAAVALRTE